MNNYSHIYKSWIFISVTLHFVIIVTVIVTSSTHSHRAIAIGDNGGGSINVDVVGMPNVLKKDLALLNQQKEEVTHVIKHDEMVLPNSKKTAAEKKNALAQLKDNLQTESTYLKKIKIIKGIKQSIGIGKITDKVEKPGIGSGTGSGVGNSTDNIPSNPYFNTMKDMIKSYWKVPGWVNLNGLNTLILVKVNSSGDIYEIEVTKQSGNPTFDNLAYNAVKNASPFPTPPISLKDTLQDGVILSFP